MPDIRKDKHSGALIFDLTPAEKDIIDLKENYQSLSEKFDKLQEQINSSTNQTLDTK
jgi:hypothetical protein